MSKQTAQRRAVPGAIKLGAITLIGMACQEAPIDTTNYPPQGVFEGTVTYAGPLPCVQRGHVVGGALLLVFNQDLLPPPEGLGTNASQFGLVPGDTLFDAVTSQLPFSAPDDDRVLCPPDDAPPVTVSARWTIGPVPAGRYQIRGFYDRDGDFSPILKLHQLPTSGDIGGGAIANVSEVLQGAPVRYQTIEVGVPDANGKLAIPAQGAIVRGITATLGQTLPFSRPIFHVARVNDERPATFTDKTGAEVTAPPLTLNTDPTRVVLPQDERFLVAPTSYPTQATKMFLRVVFGAGLPGAADDATSERALGSTRPYSLQTLPPLDTFWLYAGVNADGSIKTVPETPSSSPAGVIKVANLFPQAIFARLDSRDPLGQTAQAKPAVILQGLVLNQGGLLGTTVGSLTDPATGRARLPKLSPEVEVALRPSVICIPEPQDVSAPVYVVTPRFTALNGEPIIDPSVVADEVRKQLGNRPNIQVIEGCLPKGKYQINLVYDTGQAWTVPNEAGVCTVSESAEGASECSQGEFRRQRLPSQAVTVEVGEARDASFCGGFAGAEFVQGVPAACLRAGE